MHWPREGWGNTDTHRNGRDMESQGKCPHVRTLSLEGGPDNRGPIPSQGLSKQRVQEQGTVTKSGMTGSSHQRPVGGTAPGGGGGTPPQAGGALRMTRGMMNQVRRKMRRMIPTKKLYR